MGVRASPIPDLHELAVADPRGRTEEGWLDVLEYLVARLSEATGAEIEIGAYWIDGGPDWASAALGARIRADGPLPGVGSDCWEAALCVTGGSEGAYADVFAFPFLRGSVVVREGRMEDLGGEHEVEEFLFHYADRKWEVFGFRYPDGPGEWDHVRRPGDAFFRGVRCTGVKGRFSTSEPLMVCVDRAGGGDRPLGEDARLSIHRLLRDGREIVGAPPRVPLPRPGSSGRVALGSTTLPAVFRLDSVPIPGGWGPGRYRLEARLGHARGAGSYDSDISGAAELEVSAS